MAADATLSARRELAAAIVARTEAEAAVTNCERAIEAAITERHAAFARRERLQEEHAEQQRVQGGPAGVDADRFIARAAGLAPSSVADARDIGAEIVEATRAIERVDQAIKIIEQRASDATFQLTLRRQKASDAVGAVVRGSAAAATAIADFADTMERALRAASAISALARVDAGRFNRLLSMAPLAPGFCTDGASPWARFEAARAPSAAWLEAFAALHSDASTPLPGERAVKL